MTIGQGVDMHLSVLARHLYDEIAQLTIIDAHEHLPSDAEYPSYEYCGPNMLSGGYVWHDLESAGMPPEIKNSLRDGGYRPVEEWWSQIRPFWEYVRHISFARALQITARDLFGIEHIDDSTIHALAERVQADNTPGLYYRILQEYCRIRASITCVETVDFPHDPVIQGLSDRIGRAINSSLSEGGTGSLSKVIGIPLRFVEGSYVCARIARDNIAKVLT